MSLLKSSQLGQIIWEGRKIIVIAAVLAVALGVVFESYRAPIWKATVPIVVAPTGEKESADFNYDHFYSLEATDTLTDSLEEWLKNPAVRLQVAEKTKTQFKSRDWRFWENDNWKISKKAPQLIEATFFTQTESSARLIEDNLKARAGEYLDSFNQSGKPYFNLTNSTSAVEFVAPVWSLVIILSILWGSVIGVLIVLEKENLRRKE